MEMKETMDVDRIMAETDILTFLDVAFCDAGAFGYTDCRETEETKAMESLMEYLGKTDMSDKQWREAEPLVNDMILRSEEEGFRRGFGIALRIIIAGLNTGRKG